MVRRYLTFQCKGTVELKNIKNDNTTAINKERLQYCENVV